MILNYFQPHAKDDTPLGYNDLIKLISVVAKGKNHLQN
jgi:hypothetical protein